MPQRDPLAQSPQAVRIDKLVELRLTRENYLQKLRFGGFEICQKPDFFQHLDWDVLCLVEQRHYCLARAPLLEEKMMNSQQPRLRSVERKTQLGGKDCVKLSSCLRRIQDIRRQNCRAYRFQKGSQECRLPGPHFAREHGEAPSRFYGVAHLRQRLAVRGRQVQERWIRR